MMHIGWIIMAIWSLWFSRASDTQVPTSGHKSTFTARVADESIKRKQIAFTIIIDANADMWDVDSHRLDDRALAGIFAGGTPDAGNAPLHVFVCFQDQSTTSVKVVSQAMKRLRAAADPKVETIVLMDLEGSCK